MKIPFPKAVSEALEEIWRARMPRVRYGPPGPCSPLWGGSALRWAQARRFDDLEIDAARCGFWAPTGTDEKTVEAADWFGLEPGIGRSQVLRLQEEKEYSIAAAQGDLGYAPLAFAAGLARIYGE